ncbi:hypothetical protein CR513_13165, partial [Mucuna pruriens]
MLPKFHSLAGEDPHTLEAFHGWPWHKAVSRFSSMRFSWSSRCWTHSTSSNIALANTLRKGISTSIGRTAFVPCTSEYGVAPVDVRTDVRRFHYPVHLGTIGYGVVVGNTELLTEFGHHLIV